MTAVFLAVAIFLIGLGHLILLPPFEGIDETAHYSSIRQIMATGAIPVLGESFISPEVIDYRQHGPMPYYVPITHTIKPISYGPGEIVTYPEFFASPQLTEGFFRAFRAPAPHPSYVAVTEETNWEAQHPPLYYLLMAPLMNATDALPFVSQFLALRLASFMAAFAGLMIAMYGTVKYISGGPSKFCMALGFLLYPLAVPMFFMEFGRLGNDSLCLFFMGAAWALALAWLRDESRQTCAVALGCCLGLGLLTKAFFLPIAAGFCLFAAFRLWRGRRDKPLTLARLKGLVFIAGLSLLLGGWWYIVQYARFGSITGSLDSRLLDEDFFAALHGKFSLADFIDRASQIPRSWLWYGTQSAVFAKPILYAPVYLLTAWILVEYARAIKNRPFASAAWLPVWLIAPFLAGLVWHVLLSEISGSDATPGWYLSVMAPAWATAMGYGLRRVAGDPEKRFILGGFTFYAGIFLIIAFWAQASLYAGCATRGPAPTYEYRFPNTYFCLDRLHDMASNLAVLGWPYLAGAAFGGGFLCLGLGLLGMRKCLAFDVIPANGNPD